MKRIVSSVIVGAICALHFNLKAECDPKSPHYDEAPAKNRCTRDWQCDTGRKCSTLGWCENCK